MLENHIQRGTKVKEKRCVCVAHACLSVCEFAVRMHNFLLIVCYAILVFCIHWLVDMLSVK